MVARPELAIDGAFTPFCLTDHRRELANHLGRLKLENGVPGYETLRAIGATEEALKLWDVVVHDDPPIESFVHLCRHLRKIATNRRLHELCKHYHRLVMDDDADLLEVIPKLETQFLGLRDLYEGRQKEGGVRKGSDVSGLVALLEKTVSRKGKLMGLRTGFPRIDAVYDGLCPGRLYLVGARPSVGKTSFMLSAAVHLLDGIDEDQGPTRGMIFTLEMPFDDIQMNMLVILSRVSRLAMKEGHIKAQLMWLKECCTVKMPSWDYEIDDTPGIEIDILCHRARKAHAEAPLQWIMIDYLQLIKGSNKSSKTSRQVEIGEISSKLKALAKELGIPIIALAQLKRQEKVLDKGKGVKVNPRPKLEDLRESGDLEQDADGVTLLHRDMEAEDASAEAIIAKNRFGALAYTIPLVFEKELSKYKSVA